jgi:hypothetical protein
MLLKKIQIMIEGMHPQAMKSVTECLETKPVCSDNLDWNRPIKNNIVIMG